MEKVVIVRPRSNSFSGSSSVTKDSLQIPEIKLNGRSVDDVSTSERRMRLQLRWFFMTTCDKYRTNGTWPMKLILQLAKVLLVTIQLMLFGSMRSARVHFLEGNSVTFQHLYLKGWELSYEAAPYPPSHGKYSVFTVPQFYDHINFALEQFYNTEELSVGPFRRHLENDNHVCRMTMCLTEYEVSDIWTPSEAYQLNLNTISGCFSLDSLNRTDKNGTSYSVYDVETYMKEKLNKTISFDRLVSAELKFKLKSVHLKNNLLETPECFQYYIKILYDNTRHSGRIPVTLSQKNIPFECKGKVIYQADDYAWEAFLSVFDVTVIIVSLLSLFLCIRSIIKAYILKSETVEFFQSHLQIKLSFHEQLEFLNLWYVLIVINDVLTIIGSIYKILIISKLSSNYESCSLLLGSGNLLVWFGVLRYLNFFNKYNVLIITIKRALPSVLRFLVCVSVITLGFTFCGWAVLGPYHLKFQKLSTALECLFSLMNGDELFTTFATIGDHTPEPAVWWYSRIYLYVFLCLYIYCILSLFVAIIMESYDTVKFHYLHGFPQSELWKFIDKDNRSGEDESSYRKGDRSRFWTSCCGACGHQSSNDEEHDKGNHEDLSEKSKLLRRKEKLLMYTL